MSATSLFRGGAPPNYSFPIGDASRDGYVMTYEESTHQVALLDPRPAASSGLSLQFQEDGGTGEFASADYEAVVEELSDGNRRITLTIDGASTTSNISGTSRSISAPLPIAYHASADIVGGVTSLTVNGADVIGYAKVTTGGITVVWVDSTTTTGAASYGKFCITYTAPAV